MQANITTYDADGRIGTIISCPETMVDIQNIPDGGGYVSGVFDERAYYVDVASCTVTTRPTMTASIDKLTMQHTETAILTGPEGAEVTITGPVSGAEILDANGLEISSDIPGTYTIKVSLFPYLDAEYTLEITEP